MEKPGLSQEEIIKLILQYDNGLNKEDLLSLPEDVLIRVLHQLELAIATLN